MTSARVLPVVIAFVLFGCASADLDPTDPSWTDASDPASSGHDPQPSDSSGSTVDAEPSSSTSGDPFVDGFVAAHNQVRARVSPAANPPLPEVRWSPELAAQAQRWAQRCEFEHSDTESGENLSARSDMADPATIVDAWAAEVEHFDHRRNRCASGEVCGHYTQVVWRGTTQIGCAVAQCSSNSPFGSGPWVMWVCNYDPPGNYNGERPY